MYHFNLFNGSVSKIPQEQALKAQYYEGFNGEKIRTKEPSRTGS